MTPAPDGSSLRSIFDEAAELYDRARPGYPAALFDDLAGLACCGPGCRVLEIGCGTGQASVPLAARGCALVCVELGPSMAAVARRNLARFPAARVVTAAFEDWPLPPEPFDLVLSATAFHWLDPAVRVVKSADALRPGGALATIATYHVAGGPLPSSMKSRPATSAGTRRPRPASASRPRRRFPATARRWIARAASGRPSSAATNGTAPIRRPATSTCCAPTPTTGRSHRRRDRASSPASPISSMRATAATSSSTT